MYCLIFLSDQVISSWCVCTSTVCWNNSVQSLENSSTESCVLCLEDLCRHAGGPTATLGPMFCGYWHTAVEQPSSWS